MKCSKVLFVFFTCIFLFGMSLNVKADFSNKPDVDMWVTDGAVHDSAVSSDGSTIYIGGAFNYVGPNTGSGVPIDASTGENIVNFPKVNATVYTSISDGAGGFYIGGNFTKVGEFEIRGIAHILSDYSVDSDWNPNPYRDGFSGTISTIVLDSSRNILYVGGNFTSIGGQARNNIAVLDANTGIATDWSTSISSYGQVEAIVASSDIDTIYVGGKLIITSDHGNAEKMFDEKENQAYTFHTKNPVPFLLVSDKFKKTKMQNGGVLGNIAPTILDIMDIEKPKVMAGESLLKKWKKLEKINKPILSI